MARAEETPEQRLTRRREQDIQRRARETPEEREQRLARQREQGRERRARETPEQREQRLARQREACSGSPHNAQHSLVIINIT